MSLFFLHLRLKNWWQHLVYGVDESDEALPCFCASANCPSMETTHLTGAKTCLDVCFLGKKPSALINTLKGSLINDTSLGLLHKGGFFCSTFSQKIKKINDVIIGTESSTPGNPFGVENTQYLTTAVEAPPGCLQQEQHH